VNFTYVNKKSELTLTIRSTASV